MKKFIGTFPALVALGIAALSQRTFAAEQTLNGADSSGLAAGYTGKLAGHKTASGKTYDPSKLTAAHRTLPFGTHVKVTNPANGNSVVVIITDRGRRQQERVLDLSASAAEPWASANTKWLVSRSRPKALRLRPRTDLHRSREVRHTV